MIQRVSRASVTVGGRVVGSIGRGLLVLVGVTAGDGDEHVTWVAEKIAGLRIFPDDEGKMNRSVTDIGGAVLLVSQFTLYGDVRKGRRPSFVAAAPPEVAEPVYEHLAEALRAQGLAVATGVFGAMMHVELVNDGPVTLWLER